MLNKRLITALWGIPLLVIAIWFDRPLPWFTLLVAIWGLLAIFEFYRMAAANKVSPLVYFGLIWTLLFILRPHFENDLSAAVLLSSGVVLSLIWLLVRPRKEGAFIGWAWTIAGILYVGWLLSHLVALRGMDGGRDWLLLALFTNIGSDSSAFFTGRVLGKHHLAPGISPGKTWEGAVGGILGAVVASLIMVTILNLPLSYGQVILLALLISVFGQTGDLVESLLKRNMGVKDSGRLIPGHGGFLDRIDSVLFVGVLVYYYVLLYNAGWLNWL